MSIPVASNFVEDARAHFAQLLASEGFNVADEIAKAKATCSDPKTFNEPQWLARQWFNITRRRIAPCPRRVVRSHELLNKQIDPPHAAALSRIEADSTAGRDLWPYLSKSIDRLEYEDALMNDWGIHHFHLGAPQAPGDYVVRTGPLLFGLVRADAIYFVDIFTHGSWTEDEVVETIHTNWPEAIAPNKCGSIRSAGPRLTPAERTQARKAGMQTFYETKDGTIYGLLGGGYATSGASIAAMTYGDRVMNAALNLETWLKEHSDDARDLIATKLGRTVEELHLRLEILEDEAKMQVIETAVPARFDKFPY